MSLLKFKSHCFCIAAALASLTVLLNECVSYADFADEVSADDPAFWWRMDEPDGEDFAENIGRVGTSRNCSCYKVTGLALHYAGARIKDWYHLYRD